MTSGTLLASRKLPLRTLVLALVLSVHSVEGKAACQVKRELGVDYETAFVLSHKLREAVAAEREHSTLDGVVEMDGMRLGGHARPENKAEKRVDRRIAENQTGQRMAVVAMRGRGPGNRTLAAAAPDKRPDVAWRLVKNHVARGAELRAHEHGSYDGLVGLAKMVRNDHSVAYVSGEDASINQAESFFSRARRAESGIFHRMAGIPDAAELPHLCFLGEHCSHLGRQPGPDRPVWRQPLRNEPRVGAFRRGRGATELPQG